MILFEGDVFVTHFDDSSSFDDDFLSLVTYPLLKFDELVVAGITPFARLSKRLNGKSLILRGDLGDLLPGLVPFIGKWFVPLWDPPRIAGSAKRLSLVATTEESKAAGALDLCVRGSLGISKPKTSSLTSNACKIPVTFSRSFFELGRKASKRNDKVLYNLKEAIEQNNTFPTKQYKILFANVSWSQNCSHI